MTLVTEKEAVEKWCPLARVAENGSNVPFSFNRIQTPSDSRSISYPPGSVCIGSRCMAWRWHKTHVKISDMYAEDCGFCGAFGKVEP